MAKPKTMMIDDVEYVRKTDVKVSIPDGDIKIVILQRGWVMIGYYSRDGENCSLEKARVIRRWGTKKGLGELALGGKLENTVLEPCHGLVEFHRLTEVAVIGCQESAWNHELT